MFKKTACLVLIIAGLGLIVVSASAATPKNLRGRFLVPVSNASQAWYVYPKNDQRYLLAKPDAMLSLATSLGVKISNKDFTALTKKFNPKYAGYFLIKYQDKNKRYYLDPANNKLYYLGSMTNVKNLLKARGIKTDNKTLALVAVYTAPPKPMVFSKTSTTIAELATGRQINYVWNFKNKIYNLKLAFDKALYSGYANDPKRLVFYGSVPTDSRDQFYAMFLKNKYPTDNAIVSLVNELRKLALANKFTSDQTVDLAMAFVQSLPYDEAKAALGTATNTKAAVKANYPYETLYVDTGICADKTILAVAILRQLGYGAAVLDFPELNHTAIGISCPNNYSLRKSSSTSLTAGSSPGLTTGWCYIESTNFFPVGVVPQKISGDKTTTGGVDVLRQEIANFFNDQTLGKIEIYQKTAGKTYQRVSVTRQTVDQMKALETQIDALKIKLDAAKAEIDQADQDLLDMNVKMTDLRQAGNINDYNDLVPQYNLLSDNYNLKIKAYQAQIKVYNTKVEELNQLIKNFYQL